MVYIFLMIICTAGICMVYGEYIKQKLHWDWLREKAFKKQKELELMIMKKNKSRLDKELFNSSVILKNLSLVQKNTPFSADYMYEKIMENSFALKPVYGQMLAVYRSRNSNEAFKILPMTVGTRASKNFAIILSKLEKLNPAELEKQMEVFQKSMLDLRVTYGIKKVQRNSLLITVFATITVFALLLNFVVVVVFLDTIETLNQLFM